MVLACSPTSSSYLSSSSSPLINLVFAGLQMCCGATARPARRTRTCSPTCPSPTSGTHCSNRRTGGCRLTFDHSLQPLYWLTFDPSMCVTGLGWAGCGIGLWPSCPPTSLGSGPRRSEWAGPTSRSGGGSSLPLAVSAALHRPRPPPPPKSGRAKVTAAHLTLPASAWDQTL